MKTKKLGRGFSFCGCPHVRSTRVPMYTLYKRDASQQKTNPFVVAAKIDIHVNLPLFYEIGTKCY